MDFNRTTLERPWPVQDEQGSREMTIERQPVDVVVMTVVLTNGLTVEHRYPVGQVRNRQEYERFMISVFREPYEAMMGISGARAFMLAYPMSVYNTAHVMTLRLRGEGSTQAVEMADHVHEMGFLARGRSGERNPPV